MVFHYHFRCPTDTTFKVEVTLAGPIRIDRIRRRCLISLGCCICCHSLVSAGMDTIPGWNIRQAEMLSRRNYLSALGWSCVSETDPLRALRDTLKGVCEIVG